MNKLEKILAQSVTPEMVAEQLTEREIEEVIEEYEEKAKHAEESIEYANKKEKGFLEVVERYQRSADDWKEVAEQEKGKSELYRSVVEKAKRALEIKNGTSDDDCLHTNESGHVWYHSSTGNPMYVNSNKCRAKVIKEAKEYISENERALEATVKRESNEVFIRDYGTTKRFYVYPKNLVWNKYIAMAYGIAKYNMDHKLVSKYTFEAPQPTEIVEGMDVELFSPGGGVYESGRVGGYDEQRDSLWFPEGRIIRGVKRDGYRIIGDTKAKYKEV